MAGLEGGGRRWRVGREGGGGGMVGCDAPCDNAEVALKREKGARGGGKGGGGGQWVGRENKC